MCFFFFSSRRRHTRWPRDWSSDVCSSDLEEIEARNEGELAEKSEQETNEFLDDRVTTRLEEMAEGIPKAIKEAGASTSDVDRSEERRVGKECRCQRSTDDGKRIGEAPGRA